MRIVIYGGSFNPPHVGHREAALTVLGELKPDKLLIIPASIPPHKELADESPCAQERLLLTELAFSGLPDTEISDMEIRREGKSYSSETLEEIMKRYPGAEIFFAMGTDMFLSFEEWYRFRFLLENMCLAVFARGCGDEAEIIKHAEYMEKRYGAKTVLLPHEPRPMTSTDIRDLLKRRMGASYLADAVYERIISAGDYGAKPELYWLREKAYACLKPTRIAHVSGCESEAVKLSDTWGEDAENAAEAAILHDITKKLLLSEQLILCDKYDIINDNLEMSNVKLLHAKTGAAMARECFNVSDEVYSAIRWHTTGKPDMTLLEKIIYIADYIEPNRDFEGVDELRRLAYTDLDAAMELGLRMSLEEITANGGEPHVSTVTAWEWYSRK